jgi:hypothetical protein
MKQIAWAVLGICCAAPTGAQDVKVFTPSEQGDAPVYMNGQLVRIDRAAGTITVRNDSGTSVRRDRPAPTRRLQETAQFAPPVDDARLHGVIDALDEIATQTGKSIPQIALNWLLQRPTVSTILIGARNEEQLLDNLGAVGWTLDAEQIARLDAVSALVPPYPYYPYWNGQFAERTPPPT